MHQAWRWDIWLRLVWEVLVWSSWLEDGAAAGMNFFPLLFIFTLKIALTPRLVSLGESFPKCPSLGLSEKTFLPDLLTK